MAKGPCVHRFIEASGNLKKIGHRSIQVVAKDKAKTSEHGAAVEGAAILKHPKFIFTISFD